ncbi:ATP-binding protein [Streptomyces sp. NBC_01361]|uniref:ATP-binding protein n=1 Tax=Streptomyces sp. NBC_01361 TaxID=2903838 RepID=UPI003FCCE65E
MHAGECVRRDPWGVSFLAEPREVAGLRRTMKMRLILWGLSELVEAAQVCVTELASNVIKHVGVGTPATLVVSMDGTYLRIEVRDPDARALPTLRDAALDSESGRGMALIEAAVEGRWGVVLRGDSKAVWCELATTLTAQNGHASGPPVMRAERHLLLYGAARPRWMTDSQYVGVAVAEESAIDLIADLLHWLRAHGCDPDEVLDRAQMHFEAEADSSS